MKIASLMMNNNAAALLKTRAVISPVCAMCSLTLRLNFVNVTANRSSDIYDLTYKRPAKLKYINKR